MSAPAKREEGHRWIPFVTPDEVKTIIREEMRYIPGGKVTVSPAEVQAAIKAQAEAKRLAGMRPIPPAKIVDGAEESSITVKTKLPGAPPAPREPRLPTPRIQKGGYLVPDKPELVYSGPKPKIHGAGSLEEAEAPALVAETGPQKIRTKITTFTPGFTQVDFSESEYEPKKKPGG